VAKTPYRRLLEAGVLDEATRRTLQQLYEHLDPLRLLSQIDELLERLKRLAVLDPISKEILARKSRALEDVLAREHRTAG
jgi:hypothetical protein